MPERPINYENMQKARDPMVALFANLDQLPESFDIYPLLDASYSSLCTGCTDPRASNYDPLAEVDNNSCI
jgi:hypothetical protein